MKRKRVKLIFVLTLGIVALIAVHNNRTRIDTDFATRADLKFHYIDKHIDTTITDPDDLRDLKEILRGHKYREWGIPGCGFSEDVSITLTDGRRSITFCPACDKCNGFRIGSSKWYIDVSEEQRRRFEEIVRKYGMTFPCV